jgi:hypothetical protein
MLIDSLPVPSVAILSAARLKPAKRLLFVPAQQGRLEYHAFER